MDILDLPAGLLLFCGAFFCCFFGGGGGGRGGKEKKRKNLVHVFGCV